MCYIHVVVGSIPTRLITMNKNKNGYTHAELIENGIKLAEDVASGKTIMDDGWSYIGCGCWSYFSPEIYVTKPDWETHANKKETKMPQEEEKCKPINLKRNFKVVIDLPYWDVPKYCQHDTDQTYAEKLSKAYQEFSNQINDFFKDHKEWSKVSSGVEYDDVTECSYCGHPWGTYNGECKELCVHCGKEVEHL